jgi:nitrile hydratase accessory protein
MRVSAMVKLAVLLYRVEMSDHRADAAGHAGELSDQDLRVRALASIATERGRIEPSVLDSFIDVYVARIVPHHDAVPAGDLTDAAATEAALGARAMMAIPRDTDGPLFRARWEALAFVLAMILEQRGVFTWAEWAQAFGTELRRLTAGGTTGAAAYYDAWLAGLERIAVEKELADPATMTRYQHAWDQAAARTPHGATIELRPSDFA